MTLNGILPSDVAVLKKITGKDFGEDAEKWQKWLEENKHNFGKGR